MRPTQRTVKIDVEFMKFRAKKLSGTFAKFCEEFGIDYTTFCRWNKTGWPIREYWAALWFLNAKPRKKETE